MLILLVLLLNIFFKILHRVMDENVWKENERKKCYLDFGSSFLTFFLNCLGQGYSITIISGVDLLFFSTIMGDFKFKLKIYQCLLYFDMWWVSLIELQKFLCLYLVSECMSPWFWVSKSCDWMSNAMFTMFHFFFIYLF